MDVTVSGTIDQKTYLKKFRGASAPLAHPRIRYEIICNSILHGYNFERIDTAKKAGNVELYVKLYVKACIDFSIFYTI